MISRRTFLRYASAAPFALSARKALAENAPGVTDTEIKIGQTMPYSGPASAYGIAGRVEAAYFRMINETGGVNGRRINFISLDDAYSPPKTVEQVRRLVEQERVAFLFQSLGAAPNLAVRQYLNDLGVPTIFISTGASTFYDPKRFPWTMPYVFNYRTEARIYARHMLATKPAGKIAILYQNDDFGKDFVLGVKEVLSAERRDNLAKVASYETSEPTVDSQVAALQASGADQFLIAATPKFAAQAIRKAFEIGWMAERYLYFGASSITSTLKPAGLDKSKGIIGGGFIKDVSDPVWKDDADVKAFEAFKAKYIAPADAADLGSPFGYSVTATLIQVLKQCGDDLSRENIMRQAANLKDFEAPLMFPGIRVNTSPTNYSPIRQLQLMRFNGENWRKFGDVLTD